MANDIEIARGSGLSNITTATVDIGSVHHQVHFGGQRSQAHTFIAAGNGTAVDASRHGCKSFGLQVKGTGATATSWTVVLEGSMDGTNYSTILTHTNTADSDGAAVWTGPNFAPVLHFRARCSAVVLGSATNIVATVVGM